jgi:hypothetical protein
MGFMADKVELVEVSPANSHYIDRSTLIIYHPGLVQ